MESNIIQFGNFLHKNNFYDLILSWFKKNQRHLYWRQNRSIYLTYLTEIMLQQTTVKTVENKLKSYLKDFPDFNSYKNKNLSNVLNSWSGLGYYKRAENLYRSVEIINKKYKGELPSEISQLLTLPGIGNYTANSVLAIAFNKKAFPIDVNIRRLLTRLTGRTLDDNKLAEILELILKNKKSYRNFTESMMDFSSSICKKNLPLCDTCTFNLFCGSAFQEFNVIRKLKPNIKKIDFFILKNKTSICFLQNPNFQFYQNFLHLPSNLDSVFISGIDLMKKTKIKKFNYSITNNRYEVQVFFAEIKKIKDKKIIWIDESKLSKIALPSLFKKILI